MLVYERMSRHPLTVKPKTSVNAALKRMRDERVRRFPVVDESGKLVGIVSEKDLLYAAPSPATSPSISQRIVWSPGPSKMCRSWTRS